MDRVSITSSKFIYVNSPSASLGEIVLNSSIHSTNVWEPIKCHNAGNKAVRKKNQVHIHAGL